MCNLSFSHFTETESRRVRNVWMPQDKVQKEGTPIILYSCTGNDNQRWLTDDNKIKGKQSRKCPAQIALLSEKATLLCWPIAILVAPRIYHQVAGHRCEESAANLLTRQQVSDLYFHVRSIYFTSATSG